MQKGVGLVTFQVNHFFQRGVIVGKIRAVFRMLFEPLTCYGFNSLERLTSEGLGINRAKKLANIGLRRREHKLKRITVCSWVYKPLI